MLTVGEKTVYPGQGPCVVSAIVERVIGDAPVAFYRLLILDGGGDLFIPVDKADAVGLRPLIKRSDVAGLFDRLSQSVALADCHRSRARDNSRLLAAGSAFDLAELVESLTQLRDVKSLSYGERSLLERAKRLLVAEMAAVLRATPEAVEQQVDAALRLRTEVAVSASAAPGRAASAAAARH